jgi:hypothetical protein
MSSLAQWKLLADSDEGEADGSFSPDGAPAAVFQSRSLAVSRDGSRIFLLQAVQQPPGNVIHVMVPASAR